MSKSRSFAVSEPFLSIRDAVDLGYAAESTIRLYIRQGRLPAVKIGGRIKLRRVDLDALAHPCPAPLASTDHESLRAWARAKAAGAPPLHPESLDVLVDTFAEALAQKVGVSSDV